MTKIASCGVTESSEYCDFLKMRLSDIFFFERSRITINLSAASSYLTKWKILIGKIFTNCWKFVKFINIFHRQKFVPYGSYALPRSSMQQCKS